MYYSGYSSYTNGTYDIQLAYLLTTAVYMVLCGISLLYRYICHFLYMHRLGNIAYMHSLKNTLTLTLLWHLGGPSFKSNVGKVLVVWLCPCSMAASFRSHFVLEGMSNGAWTVLCSWDFRVVKEEDIRQRKANLTIQLKVGERERAQR